MIRVTIDGVWIANRFYRTLKQLVTTLDKSLSHTDLVFLVTVFTASLGNGFNSGRSSAHGLAVIWHQPPTLLTAVSRLSLVMVAGPRYISSSRTSQKTPLPTFIPMLRITKPLPNNACFSGCYSIITVFWCATPCNFVDSCLSMYLLLK
jgi:hypothetical protein